MPSHEDVSGDNDVVSASAPAPRRTALAVLLLVTITACALDDVDQRAAADAAVAANAAYDDVAGSGAVADSATVADAVDIPAATARDVAAREATPLDATATDATATTPIPSATPPVVSAAPDPDFVAAPAELAALSAVLAVPVAGVERSQLHDTFTELRGDRPHEAIDILAPRGTPVLAAADGRLLKLFDSQPGGLMVYASDPSERFILVYGHLDSYALGLREGMQLVRGQVIGHVGTTGNAPPDTPHLHFAILRGEPAVAWWEGVPVNPYPLLMGGR